MSYSSIKSICWLVSFGYQAKNSKLTKTGQGNISRKVASVSGKLPQIQVDLQPKRLSGKGPLSEEANGTCLSNLGDTALHQTSGNKVCSTNDGLLGGQTPALCPPPLISQTKGFLLIL